MKVGFFRNKCVRTIGCLALALVCFIRFVYASSTTDVWDVLRHEFSLNHEVTQAEVQAQIRWIVSHPGYLDKLAQSEPYMYHIVTEIKKRRLPGELALIPMIESTYDPFAYSGAGAAGLWQLMPGTGRELGLKQDWWFDGRRSIRPSTDAALNYLARLHKFFNGDWVLAIAAYDSGEGKMSRVIKASGQLGKINFWKLPAPQETKAYIPRLLALAEVIQNPQRYHIQLPYIPHAPYFEEVNIGSQIDLGHAAKLAGISYRDLIKLNPGFNRWTTAPYRPYKLLVPADKADDFRLNLASTPVEERVSWEHHKVSAGDSLTLIAKRYHTTVNLIKELNQLKSNSVKKGQYVLVPKNKPVPTAVTKAPPASRPRSPNYLPLERYKVIHIVQKNDSFVKLQQKYGVSIHEIKQWNNIAPNKPLHYQQQLVIWRMAHKTGVYVVKKGDNLSTIAKNHGTKTSKLVALNPTLKKHYLKPGQRIRIG